jgi:hypothetical protein
MVTIAVGCRHLRRDATVFARYEQSGRTGKICLERAKRPVVKEVFQTLDNWLGGPRRASVPGRVKPFKNVTLGLIVETLKM